MNRGKRWELHASPWTGHELSIHLAEAINRDPERFWTRRGAAAAIHRYADELGLPVTFWVRDRRGVVD